MFVRMKGIIIFSLVSLVFSPLRTAVFAQSFTGRTETFPRIEPDPKALEFFRRGGQARNYSWAELAQISLWASGDLTASHLGQIHGIAEAVSESPQLPATGREKADFILGYMHKNLLRIYSLDQTRIDTLLAGGRYNCVSSAVLYMILCKSVDLDVSGVMTKDHAFVSIHFPREDIDVETTNPYGFDPGGRGEFHDQFGKLTGFTYVPVQNYRDRQGISSIELVSLILWNRISELEAKNRFAEAVPLAVDRAALLNGVTLTSPPGADPAPSLFEDPYQTLLDRLFNYGAFLLNSGKEEDCLRWAALASPRYPDEKRWQEFIQAAVNNRLNKYLQAGQMTEARNFLDSQRSVLSPANYAQFDVVLADTELVRGVNRIRSAAEGDNAIAAIEKARAENKINDQRTAELLTAAVQKTAAVISADRDWRGAINYIENIIARFGSYRDLEQTLQNYRNNLATDFHNRFAAAWNRGNFDEAEFILNEGLAEFPVNRQLLADRETVNSRRP